MIKLEVFDPPMCCSTGVCGPAVDPVLARFAGDLEWLRKQDITTIRFNLSKEPQSFVDSILVKKELEIRGNSCLPMIFINDRLISSGLYPQRNDFISILSGFGNHLKNDSEN
jgi:hypothetical protein